MITPRKAAPYSNLVGLLKNAEQKCYRLTDDCFKMPRAQNHPQLMVLFFFNTDHLAWMLPF